MTAETSTPLLDCVRTPKELRTLGDQELRQLADELRQETISAVSVTGGHLGAGLGVVELTVALHAVFDTPRDKIIWDVGHRLTPIRSSPGAVTASAPCVSRTACRASANAPRANTTRLAPVTPRPRFPLGSAWPWPAIWAAATTM